MTKRLLGLAIALLGMLSNLSVAQQPPPQEPPVRGRQVKPSQKPATEAQKPEPVPQIQETDEAMRRAITGLTTQVSLLAEEVARLRAETGRSSAMLELLINEQRLTKLEDRIQEATDHKAQLDARDLEIQSRMRNIQREVALRGGLRRDEAETAIRAELQRALEDNRAQQTAYQQRVADLNEQATRLRARIDSLRKKLEEPDEKPDRDK